MVSESGKHDLYDAVAAIGKHTGDRCSMYHTFSSCCVSDDVGHDHALASINDDADVYNVYLGPKSGSGLST